MNLVTPHAKRETVFRVALSLTCLLLSVSPASAQSKSLVAKSSSPRELDQREAELLRKEAAVIKQLSASAELSESTTRASISPAKAVSAPGRFEERVGIAPESAPAPGAAQPDMTQVIADKERQIETLTQEVSRLRNRLMLAETEVERLSSVIDERNKRQIGTLASSPAPSNPFLKKTQPAPLSPSIRNQVPAPAAPEQQDMQVVTVRADKAYLRTGPGDQNSPLMTVSRGTRLAVETRSGDWYRVISPAGTRAWVSAKVVVFGNLDPARATRIGGFTQDADMRGR